jgi:hypothetical protein
LQSQCPPGVDFLIFKEYPLVFLLPFCCLVNLFTDLKNWTGRFWTSRLLISLFIVVLGLNPRQVFYHLSHTPSPFVYILFLRWSLANFSWAGS